MPLILFAAVAIPAGYMIGHSSWAAFLPYYIAAAAVALCLLVALEYGDA